jgi:hypothetical protein
MAGKKPQQMLTYYCLSHFSTVKMEYIPPKGGLTFNGTRQRT